MYLSAPLAALPKWIILIIYLYDLEADPKLEKNIAQEYPHICERMKDLAIADAGGKVPEFLRKLKGEPGCTPLLVE